MAEPDMAAEVGRVKASIKQAVNKLVGDPAIEAQDPKKGPQESSKNTVTTKAEARKVSKE